MGMVKLSSTSVYLCNALTPLQIIRNHTTSQAIAEKKMVEKSGAWYKHERIFSCLWNQETHWVSFASSTASLSVLNTLTQMTGPKTSSRQICIDVLTSVMIVGSIKNPLLRCCQNTNVAWMNNRGTRTCGAMIKCLPLAGHPHAKL
jgi:hypothetical protein